MRALIIIPLFILAACASNLEPMQDRPIQAAICPDPDDRARLVPGSTFRDLAAARAESLTGWEECFNAAVENADALSAK